MKILLVGEVSKGSATFFVEKALRDSEAQVQTVNTGNFFRLTLGNRIINKFRRTPFYWGTGRINAEVLSAAKSFSPDLVLFLKPVLIRPKTISELAKTSKVFSWYPDYVLFPKTASTFFYESIPLYDCHFSFNFANVAELTKLGAKKSLFLPCAADADFHRPIQVSEAEKESLGADVVFVGTYANEPRSEYLESLCKEGYDIKIFGNGWEKHPKSSCLWRRGAIQDKALYAEDMSKILVSNKIALAFVRKHNNETLACRTFEIPACGAFLLHERTSKTGEVFEEGRDAEFFGDYEEMKKKIDFYLQHDAERAQIAKSGREKVLAKHLMLHRVREIIAVFGEMS